MNEKKETVVFNVKVEVSLRDRFVKIAKLNESDASKEVRKFIKDYVSKNARFDLKV